MLTVYVILYLIITEGTPPTTVLDGIFLVTTELDAIVTLSPIVSPPNIFAPLPIKTLFPITGLGPPASLSEF